MLNRQGSVRGNTSPDYPHHPSPRPRKRTNWFVVLAWVAAMGLLAGVVVVGSILAYFSTQVPDFRGLTEYRPALISKVYDRNGNIIAEYANERRIWVPIDEIPKPVIQAFLAAEDTHFFQHGGVDFKAILRAALVNIFTNRMQGGSTITQQVAKTFLLSSERTLTRKIKELILSWQIERAFSKNEILELYLNRIFLGNGSYGVGAAAETYFSKTLDELTVGERAMLGGMPQAPSRYNPVRNMAAAQKRRDVIIRRMEAEGFINATEADAAVAAPLHLNLSPLKQGEEAPHFAEFIRRTAVEQYGEKALYEDGLAIYTTLDLALQRNAENAVYKGLREFDRRKGWRGPLTKLETLSNWEEQLTTLEDKYIHSARIGYPAVVLSAKKGVVKLGLPTGEEGTLDTASAKWVGKGNPAGWLKARDVIMVKPLQAGETETTRRFGLEQLPVVQGALVAIDVASGDVLAMVGGLGEGVGFNRAVQAKRQVGSAFKPFVYAAALENNYTPASTILDAPVVFRFEGKEWKPSNYDNTFSGPTTLRTGLEKSRNLMTIRLAQDVGMRQVADVVRRLGIPDKVPTTDLSVALGTLNFSLIDMTSAYATFPRGGSAMPPRYLRRVQDAAGTTLYRGRPACESCLAPLGATADTPPSLPNTEARPALSPHVAYQMTSMLQGVVQHGTAYALRSLNRPVGGKTGTTNEYIDAWFVGFTPSLAVGVWVGYDTPKSLGYGETGARSAVPIWRDFVAASLDGTPVEDFSVPQGLEFVRIDSFSGLLPGVNTSRTITEVFIPGTTPTEETPAFVDAPLDNPGGATEGGALDNLLRSFGIF
ncbi:MAG: penicillin-binding protein 1A [Pseudomonadota bacterium]